MEVKYLNTSERLGSRHQLEWEHVQRQLLQSIWTTGGSPQLNLWLFCALRSSLCPVHALWIYRFSIHLSNARISAAKYTGFYSNTKRSTYSFSLTVISDPISCSTVHCKIYTPASFGAVMKSAVTCSRSVFPVNSRASSVIPPAAALGFPRTVRLLPLVRLLR